MENDPHLSATIINKAGQAERIVSVLQGFAMGNDTAFVNGIVPDGVIGSFAVEEKN